MTLMQGIKLYPKAILWSILISSLCSMEGYDIALIGNFCTLLLGQMQRERRPDRPRRFPAIQQKVWTTHGRRILSSPCQMADWPLQWRTVWADYRLAR